jgi:hypothetical protein
MHRMLFQLIQPSSLAILSRRLSKSKKLSPTAVKSSVEDKKPLALLQTVIIRMALTKVIMMATATGRDRYSTNNQAGQSNQHDDPPSDLEPVPGLTRPEVSFHTLRSHFLVLPFEERLQFLSWLFEGSLPCCSSESPTTPLDIPSTTAKMGTKDVQSGCSQTRPHGGCTGCQWQQKATGQLKDRQAVVT